MHCLGNVHEPLPRKMGNSVSGPTIPAFRRCLLSRCLANGHIPSHYYNVASNILYNGNKRIFSRFSYYDMQPIALIY
jgi:hypothetical protein